MIFDLYEQTGEFPYARGNALRGYPGPVSLIIEDGKRPKGKARWISDAKYKLEHVAARMLDEAARKGWDFEASELLPVFLVVEAFEAGWRRDETRLRECYDRLAGVNGRDEKRGALVDLLRATTPLKAEALIPRGRGAPRDCARCQGRGGEDRCAPRPRRAVRRV
jgi:hypothetical protein